MTYPWWAAALREACPGAPSGEFHIFADPDGDSWLNLFEYAFAGHPFAAGEVEPPTVGIEEFDEGPYLLITYTRRTDATDIVYSLEVSADLDEWSLPGSLLEMETEPAGERAEEVTYAVPAAGVDKRFLRVRVRFVEDVGEESGI